MPYSDRGTIKSRSRWHRLGSAVSAIVVFATAGCTNKSASTDRSDIVVQNSAPTSATPVWRLPLDSAELTLGRSDTDPDYDFEATTHRTAPVPARLGDGRVIVADGSPWPVKVFSPEGQLMKKFPA